MNRDRLHGIWRQLSGMLLHRWGTLTDNPRTADAGARALLDVGVPTYKIQTGMFGDLSVRRDRQVQVLVSAR